eukprot:scaffold330_cov246-Pinguiococcus_pyrenoidosus.AAC.19
MSVHFTSGFCMLLRNSGSGCASPAAMAMITLQARNLSETSKLCGRLPDFREHKWRKAPRLFTPGLRETEKWQRISKLQNLCFRGRNGRNGALPASASPLEPFRSSTGVSTGLSGLTGYREKKGQRNKKEQEKGRERRVMASMGGGRWGLLCRVRTVASLLLLFVVGSGVSQSLPSRRTIERGGYPATAMWCYSTLTKPFGSDEESTNDERGVLCPEAR